MNGPMMRARQHGNPCRVEGHGSRCEVSDERRVRTRAQDNREWMALELSDDDRRWIDADSFHERTADAADRGVGYLGENQ